MSAATFRAALDYLGRGWSAMAVPEASKERLRPWKKWQRRRPIPKELGAEFAAEGGTPNVAVVCGEVSGLAVLDTDGPQAEALVASLKLQPTLTVATGRGRHRYFHHTGPLPSRSRTLPGGDKVELLGDGRYVLAPPSGHPSGLPYRFEDPVVPLGELPQAVLDLFASRPRPASGAGEGPPERWLWLVARYPSVRAVWQGELADHPDRSGSGRDMRLAHVARRYGFTPEEVTAIVRDAPYPVGGGRTPDYLRRTVDRAFASVGTRRRPQAGYGQFPAWVVTSGTWARLSERAKAILPVLVVRAERPSFVVRVAMRRIAAEAKVSQDRIGKATDELAKAGIIRKAPAPGGRWNVWLQMAAVPTSSAGSAEHVKAGQPERACAGDAEEQPARVCLPGAKPAICRAKATSPAGSAEDVNHHHSAGSAEDVVSDHEWRKGLGPPPSPGRSPMSGGVESETSSNPRASMRLDSETSPQGWKTVYQVHADGSRKLVWEGTISQWLEWTPPESLRDAVAQGGATPVKTDPHRRCEATTWAGLSCVGRPMVGSPFCKRHQNRREPACAPVA
jgi:hypothetical protein